MAVSKHTRKGKPRRHTNGTFGSHVNGKNSGLKMRRKNKLHFKGVKNE